MAKKDTGGPAFPQALTVDEEFNHSEGMSLRDYFAAKALPEVMQRHLSRLPAAQLSDMNITKYGEWMTLRTKDQMVADIASDCYCLADAMLAERAK